MRSGLGRDHGEGLESGSRCWGGTSGWSKCAVAPCEGESGSIRVSAYAPACGVGFSGRHVFLVGLSRGGEWSPVVGVCVRTLFGCQSVPCGSFAVATILCVWWSHESVENVVLISSIRQPLSQREGGSRRVATWEELCVGRACVIGSGSPSSVMIWRRSVCARQGGLAGEEGGLCRRVGGCGGGVADPRLLRDGVFTLGTCVVGVLPGGSLGPGGGVGGRVVSVRTNPSKAASPPLMVRMCVGPCGEGATCTLYLVSGGRRSEFLGLPLGRFVAVAACTRGVGTPSSRLAIEVMTKPCAC